MREKQILGLLSVKVDFWQTWPYNVSSNLLCSIAKLGLLGKIREVSLPRGQIGLIVHLPGQGGVMFLYIIQCTWYLLTEILKFNRSMSIINNSATSNWGLGRSPGKILKINECSSFFDPPPFGVWNFLPPPPFGSLKLFWPPTKFSSPPPTWPRYLWTLPKVISGSSK